MNGMLSTRITNEATQKSKNIRIPESDFGWSIFETILENPAVQASHVLDWPSEINEQLEEGDVIILLSVLSDDGKEIAVMTLDDTETTSVQQLISGSGASDSVQLVLKCGEEDPDAPKLAELDNVVSSADDNKDTSSPKASSAPDALSPDSTGTRTSVSSGTSIARSGLRICLTNTLTERTKNIRVGPQDAEKSIYDTIYSHPGVQAAHVLEWPSETEEAVNSGSMKVEAFVEGTDTVMSFEDMKSTPIYELLDLMSDESAVLPLCMRAVEVSSNEKAAVRPSIASEEMASSPPKSERTLKREEEEEVTRSMDDVLQAEEETELDFRESTSMLAAEELEQLNSREGEEDSHSTDDSRQEEEPKSMGQLNSRENEEEPQSKDDPLQEEEPHSMDDLLQEEEKDVLEEAEANSILAVEEAEELINKEESNLEDSSGGGGLDEVLTSEDEKMFVDSAEESSDSDRESTEPLAAEEKERSLSTEYDQPREVESAQKSKRAADHEEELDRLIKAKEMEHAEFAREENERRENARMKALEERAAQIQRELGTPKGLDTPRDRTLQWQEPRRRKARVKGRLQQVEQSFKPDPNRKRSPDVVPLSLNCNAFLRKLRLAVEHAKAYRSARKEMEAARGSMMDDFSSLAKDSPLQEHVCKMLDNNQISSMTAVEAQRLADDIGIRSCFSVYQIASKHEKEMAPDFDELVLDVLTEWDSTVTARVEKAMKLHKKLEQDVLHYENKLSKLRNKAQETEAKGREMSPKQSDRLNRNEKKLNDAWQLHELESGAICNLFEEIAEYGWNELFPVVKSSIDYEITRMKRENSCFGYDLPLILRDLKDSVAGAPATNARTLNIQGQLENERVENRNLEIKVNKAEAALHGSWNSKEELLKELEDSILEMQTSNRGEPQGLCMEVGTTC